MENVEPVAAGDAVTAAVDRAVVPDTRNRTYQMTPFATGEAIVLVVIIMMVVFAFVFAGMRPRRLRREVQGRPDRAARWRSEFPNDMPAVDRVLTIFCDAFMFDENHKYNFVPEDDVTIMSGGALCERVAMK